MPPRRPRGPGWPDLLIGLALACRPAGGSDDVGTGGDEDSGTDSDAEAIANPAFVNPALGEFAVASTQHVPKDIVVNAIALGNTQLLVDGHTAGTLGPGSPIGELTGDRLRIFLHGALTLGTHTLQLTSSSPGGPLFSAKLTMVVSESYAAPPPLRVEFADEPLDVGDDLFTAGAGPGALLGVLTRGPAPTLRLRLADGDGWPADPTVEVGLEGHVFSNMSFGPDVSARAAPPIPGTDIAALRVAYRRGLPGDAVLTRDVTLGAEPVVGPVETAVDLADPLFAGAEFAALGRPFLFDRAVIAELTAADDSEVPHPGDRGLALVRRRTDDAGWAAPARVSTPGQLDLDALGPVLDLAAYPGNGGLSVRVGQRLGGLLTLSDAGAPVLSLPLDDIVLPAGDPGVITTITSNLGSRTVALATRDRGFYLAFLGTSGELISALPKLPADGFPDLPATGPPAAAVFLGLSTFLVPYGDAAPVHVVSGEGTRVYASPLAAPEPIHCRAVALRPGLGGNDDSAPALPFACLDGGVVRVGVLAADPSAP